jgi:hypothetical protein
MTDKERLSLGLLTETEQKPAVFEDLHNGQQTKLYNHNIKKEWVKHGEQGEVLDIKEVETEGYAQRWQYDSLRVEYPVDADNTFKTLINAKWGVDKESQMQNEYQSAVLGLLPESYKEPYLAFLSERLELKAMIEGDFLNNASE